MKKALIILMALFGLVAFIFFSFRNERAVATSAAQQWPGQMGTLEAVADRWPRQEANRASVNLTSLAETLPKNDKALDAFRRALKVNPTMPGPQHWVEELKTKVEGEPI